MTRAPTLTAAVAATVRREVPPPLLVGERLNAEGSRTVKRLLVAGDFDGLLAIAREQVALGAQVLDVCVAMTGSTGEAGRMAALVDVLTADLDVPLAIDSADPAVLAHVVPRLAGRVLINSVSLAHGRASLDRMVRLAIDHDAVLVALAIDEQGMARTRDRAVAIARRIHDIAVGEHGLAPAALMLDALVFPVAARGDGPSSAVETMAAVRLIKRELPGVATVLGISDVSFRLAPAARAVLNTVFLHHSLGAGLDAAIVNLSLTPPYDQVRELERRLAEDVLFGGPDALRRFEAQIAGAGSYSQAPETRRNDVTSSG